MNADYSLLAILIGLAVRLALPIAVTMLAIYFLRKLDLHWQEEAKHELGQPAVEKVECWALKECSVEKQKTCPARPALEPCWQVKRLPNGYLQEDCLDCAVFRNAPVPVAHAHA
jgi:hypothetical protein